MRTPLTVATGIVLLAGVVVGVTTAKASSDDTTGVEPIRVDAPQVPDAVAGVETAVPELPVQETVPQQEPAPLEVAPRQEPAPQRAPRQEAPRDPGGYVAPPPADDDDDDDGGGEDDD